MGTLSYKCPGCGGPLKWDASKQQYSCEYCLSGYTEEELKRLTPQKENYRDVTEEEAEAMNAAGGKAEASGKVRLYQCPSCGAQIVTDETTAASSCYYCHTPVVMEDRLKGISAPDKVIPFTIDKAKAETIFKNWLGKRKYAPKGFFDPGRIDGMTGVYFPYWIYNAQVHGQAQGTGEKDRVWTSGSERYTETSVFRIDKSGDMPVSNLSRLALNKASRVLCESVAPFDYEKMRPFSNGYLSGFFAECRDVEKSTIETDVRDEVRSYAANMLRNNLQAGYTRVRLTNVRTEITKEHWEYVLMPVWTVTYKDRDGKIYYFSVNGSTGKTVGELPVDKGRLALLFAKIFVPVFAVLMVILYFLG